MWISECGLIDTCQPTDRSQTTWNGADEHNLPIAASVPFKISYQLLSKKWQVKIKFAAFFYPAIFELTRKA